MVDHTLKARICENCQAEYMPTNGRQRYCPACGKLKHDDNCNKVTILTKFIKSIPNVQLATLSRLSPNMKLKPHRGWGSHSNHVLRAHYGLIIPDNCYVKVNDEIQYHQNDKWMVFDDSETHMAENQSDKDRLVLIIDISRPNHIPKGTSTIGDSKELLDIIDYFKQKQISI